MNLKNKNVLVTGGAGFIGSHLCESIAKEKPRRLVVVDNLFLGKKSNLKQAKALFPGLKFYKDSVSDYKSIRNIILKNKIDVVFNLAVIPLSASLIKPKMSFSENVSSVLNLCELVRKKCFKTLIHCSSSEAYGTAIYVPMDEKHPLIPTTPYAASKVAGDMLCLSYAKVFGVDLAIARPFNNYGPRQNSGAYAGVIPIVINNALRKRPVIINGDGRQTRDFIFVRDTAKSLIDIYKVKSTRNKIINVASGVEISVNRLVNLIIRTMESNGMVTRHGRPRPGDVRRHCAGIKLARRLLNFKTQVGLEEGLLETVQWYKNRRRGR